MHANCWPSTSTCIASDGSLSFFASATELTRIIASTSTSGTAVQTISIPVWPWIGGPSLSSSGFARNFTSEYTLTEATTEKIAMQIAVTNQKTKSIRSPSSDACSGSHGMKIATAVAIAASTRATRRTRMSEPARTAREPTGSTAALGPRTEWVHHPHVGRRRQGGNTHGNRSQLVLDRSRRDPRLGCPERHRRSQRGRDRRDLDDRGRCRPTALHVVLVELGRPRLLRPPSRDVCRGPAAAARLEKTAERIDRSTTEPHLEVQARPRCAATGANASDEAPARDSLTDTHRDLREVGIHGANAARVGDDDEVAPPPVGPAGERDAPCGRGSDPRADGARVVDPCVEPGSARSEEVAGHPGDRRCKRDRALRPRRLQRRDHCGSCETVGSGA